MSARLSGRLARLLNLVPYFQAHPGISAAEAARDLGVTPKQIMDDLNQLWVCGLPGYGPGDLIDLSFSEDSIVVTFTAGIDRPLRLTSTEATALLVALRSLLEMPGVVEPAAAQSAIAKIEAAAGTAATAHTPDGAGAAVTENPVAGRVRDAVRRGRALHLTYYSASRDTVSERVVDPIRIVLIDEHTYLQAWCRTAEGVRLFRFDRIDEATVLDEAAQPPQQALSGDEHLELFEGDPALPAARLRLEPGYTWLLDYYPLTDVEVFPDGSCEAVLRYASRDWMVRLLVGLGSGVTVLAPAELVSAVRTRAGEALEAYAALDDAGRPA
ncbi:MULTISPECIES: helix-turn-helix transcriptional regulator [unclassified Rhodococcus (in: high G+C Gram-positive bacteria)]|uniref:helix-turn-helix transcriptional regulator n=1 Tax=unclassified Rhodococcus (in: high G+C Gram-positive bacteria) TaxID=192944 RepID=UPI00146DF56D|nr:MULTISPECIES: YafY family protein [unclassified Rhodococcus (in: high G+C Gram-positive bacteria)]MBF0660462.1 YafY family transcriptional regulator [Rhodococcus sp. (in: high G+C Gram-positive bacteria)]NMD96979.1 YafY family transcriptional regulator [Rhodococcus sp. BL-253-APC-6A1W]NME79112.1 YafY family transcriptional regulator [Rhodococcus sp. 105337]